MPAILEVMGASDRLVLDVALPADQRRLELPALRGRFDAFAGGQMDDCNRRRGVRAALGAARSYVAPQIALPVAPGFARKDQP